MAEFKYAIVRYFAEPIKDEPVNVGLILHSASDPYVGFRLDLRRAASELTRADKDTFKHFEEELEPIENDEINWEAASFENVMLSNPDFLNKLEEYIGNKIRFEAPRGCVTQDPDQTLDELFARFISARAAIVPRITKRTIVREVKQAFEQRGFGVYVKTRPTVIGRHRDYTLPLGIRHSERTFVEVLKLGGGADKNYRAMAAVGRLWKDARNLPSNRHASLCALIH
jgi:Protein of unknown function (DUF3037)